MKNDTFPFDDLSNVLGEDKIEIIGGLLYDAPIEEFSIKYKNSFPRCLQHRGIGLNIGGDNFIQAYDINAKHTPQERDSDYLQVVATTGALMAIRKEFFLNIGGFSEKYIYGQEDVDICLRASLEHQAKIAVCNKNIIIVCINIFFSTILMSLNFRKKILLF